MSRVKIIFNLIRKDQKEEVVEETKEEPKVCVQEEDKIM